MAELTGARPRPGVRTVDYHTGGEPFRIVPDPPGAVGPVGATVAERRVAAASDPDLDGLRRLLCSEPRGHAAMYGGFVVPPDDAGAHLGVLFWHRDGFATACGHGTMALGAWALHSGLVRPHPSGVTEVVLDVPSGRVSAAVHADGDQVTSVDFVGVAGYVLHDRVPLRTSHGDVEAVLAYGGAIYAQVAAGDLGLRVAPEHLGELVALARETKVQLTGTPYAAHPLDGRLSGVYGVTFVDDLGEDEHGPVQRNVTVFADGQVDRSPCGSGTGARLATLVATGRLRPGQRLLHRSVVDSVFVARVREHCTVAGRPAVVPVVSGTSFRTGEHLFVVDPHDPITPGFVLG